MFCHFVRGNWFQSVLPYFICAYNRKTYLLYFATFKLFYLPDKHLKHVLSVCFKLKMDRRFALRCLCFWGFFLTEIDPPPQTKINKWINKIKRDRGSSKKWSVELQAHDIRLVLNIRFGQNDGSYSVFWNKVLFHINRHYLWY